MASMPPCPIGPGPKPPELTLLHALVQKQGTVHACLVMCRRHTTAYL
jgi:hypothetical protein